MSISEEISTLLAELSYLTFVDSRNSIGRWVIGKQETVFRIYRDFVLAVQ